MGKRILVINPGSTSTKVALFCNTRLIRVETLHHTVEQLTGKTLLEQVPFRMQSIRQFMSSEKPLDAVVGRGGLLHPVESGTYLVNEDMLKDLGSNRYGQHASNLGAFMAKLSAEEFGSGCAAMVVDPVVVDELDDVARLSGMPLVPRRSLFHALNQKAVARRVAAEMGKQYADARLVVAHMGGGITVGAHRDGRVIDVNNGLDGEGPMSPERCGGLPVTELVKFCFASGLSREEIDRKLVGKGGLVAHLGTNDFREVESKSSSDAETATVVGALALQVAKEIGRAMVTLCGCADAIVLTGGLARSAPFVKQITQYVERFARVIVIPGEDEALALAEGALRVLTAKEQPRTYVRWPDDAA